LYCCFRIFDSPFIKTFQGIFDAGSMERIAVKNFRRAILHNNTGADKGEHFKIIVVVAKSGGLVSTDMEKGQKRGEC